MRPQNKKAAQSSLVSFEVLLGIVVILCFLLLNEDLIGFKSKFVPSTKTSSIAETLPSPAVEVSIKVDIPIASDEKSSAEQKSLSCDDPIWCNIEMPAQSYYKFDPPTDINRWRRAQQQAAQGEQVFLKRISEVFTHPFDFLDGRRQIRYIVNSAN